MRDVLRQLLFTAAVFVISTSTARADRPHVFIGAIATTGAHESFSSRVRGVIVAFPSFALRVPLGRAELQLEDVPPIGAEWIKAGYADGIARYWSSNRRWSVGLGESLYVRASTTPFGSAHEYAASRGAGPRFDIQGMVPLGVTRQIVLSAALSPSMHARYFPRYDQPGFVYIGSHFERASLIDVGVRFEDRKGGAHILAYGVRYFNYGARFDSGAFVERTAAITPFVTWGFSI